MFGVSTGRITDEGVATLKRIRRAAFCLIFCFASIYACCVLQVLAERKSRRLFRGNREEDNQTLVLPDLGFDFIEELDYELTDYCVVLLFCVTFLRFALCGTTPMKLAILRRWTFCLGMLFILRGMCISVTLLPNPDHKCLLEYSDRANLFKLAFYALVKRINTCADVMFSGHSVNATLAALIWHQYSHISTFRTASMMTNNATHRSKQSSNRYSYQSQVLAQRIGCCDAEKLLVWAFTLTIYVLIISTRFHYTVDVLVGTAFTLLFWMMYHYALVVVLLRRQSEDSQERLSVPLRVVQWLEDGTPDMIEYDPKPHSFQDASLSSLEICFRLCCCCCIGSERYDIGM